jgi:hypothetical protein
MKHPHEALTQTNINTYTLTHTKKDSKSSTHKKRISKHNPYPKNSYLELYVFFLKCEI